MCGDSEDAKDVLQDTLLAASRTVADFRGDSSVSTWLYTIARSFCIKRRRRSKFAPVGELSLDHDAPILPSTMPAPDELAAHGQVSVDAVKSRLHRARATVRASLATALGDVAPPRAPGRPDVLTAFSRRVEGDLEPHLCAELQVHVDGCAARRATCDSLKQTLAVCASELPGPVPVAVRDALRAALRSALR